MKLLAALVVLDGNLPAAKNCHWHVSGPHFRDYHLLLDEQADQIFASTDVIVERVRKIGGNTLGSIGDISRQQRLADNDAPYVDPQDMLAELRDDNQHVVASMRKAQGLCDEHEDVATASLLEVFIDESERRVGSCTTPAARTTRQGFRRSTVAAACSSAKR